MRGWQSILRSGLLVGLAIALSFSLMSCGGTPQRTARPTGKDSASLVGRLSEVSPPPLIQELRQQLEQYQPQVKILSPRADEVFQEQEVNVRLQVRDLPIFKNEAFGLGPHLHVFLDNQPYQAIYSTDDPLVLTDLTPGTHTLRVFASRPWHESFKNEGAYAQVTFHIYAKTGENQPSSNQPVLTYSRPQGTYGAEPVMLDFYLTNAPLHLVAQENPDDDIRDWRVKCTVNGESFLFDAWEPIYLKGLKPGKNWVQLELVDEKGGAIANAFNNTVRIVNYEPGGSDTLSKLTRGEVAIAEVKGIVDPSYIPPEPEPEPIPEPEPEMTSEPSPEPALEVIPEPEMTPTPEPTPSPVVVPVIPRSEPSPVEPPPLEEPAIEEADTPDEEPAEAVPPILEEPATPLPATPLPAAPAPQLPASPRGVKSFFERLRERVPVPVLQPPSTPKASPSVEASPAMTEPSASETPAQGQPVPPQDPAQPPPVEEPAPSPAAAVETPAEALQPPPTPKPSSNYLERFRRSMTERMQPVPPAPSPVEPPAIAPQFPEEMTPPSPMTPPMTSTPSAVRPVPLPVITPSPEASQMPEESMEERIKRAVEARRRARLGQTEGSAIAPAEAPSNRSEQVAPVP